MTDATSPGDPAAGERRRRLLGVKLRALVSEHLATAIDAEPVVFGAGAALAHDGGSWVIIDGPAARSLGPALAWALRNGADSLDVVAEADGGVIARRAAGFSLAIRVWFAEERTLLPVVADPIVAPPAADPEHLALLDLVEAAGAVPHVERGVVTGEVRGLEVCRVVDEPTTGNFAELADVPSAESVAPDDAELAARLAGREADGVILEVGVGANDREAFQMLHGHLPTVDALAGVVSAVSTHRDLSSPQHPLNRMAPERFLRWRVEHEPSLLGLATIDQREPPVDRLSMKHTEPCVGIGTDHDGRAVLVVFSVGVDLDLAPFVADALAHLADRVDRVIVALPERDLLGITGDLLASLRQPVDIVTVADPA